MYYEVRQTAAKGLGVFAKQVIPRGTRIFSERPLLAITRNGNASELFVAPLSLTDRQQLLQLSTHLTKELSMVRWSLVLWYSLQQAAAALVARTNSITAILTSLSRTSLQQRKQLLDVFRNNSFELTGKLLHQAVFRGISRINHSCVPNTQGNYNEALGRFNVHATRDISVDEELTLNYLSEHGALHASRQEKLLSGYGFQCACPACDLTSPRGQTGEARRRRLHAQLAKYASEQSEGVRTHDDDELHGLLEFMAFFKDEGLAGRELAAL